MYFFSQFYLNYILTLSNVIEWSMFLLNTGKHVNVNQSLYMGNM